jgi:menaquinone-9 beta-reductase
LSQPIHYTTDVLIAGAGPGGAATAIFLGQQQVKHIIIDKAVFPRDKVCGDALSGKTVSMLKRINANWKEVFVQQPGKAIISNGIQFTGSGNTMLQVPFLLDNTRQHEPCGFVSRRVHFDHSLLQQINSNFSQLISNCSLQQIQQTNDGLLVTVMHNGQAKTIFTKMIVGAEGRDSIVAKKMAGHHMQPNHFSAGIRGYYSNVSGMHSQNFIELHFLNEVQPGYLWIFPLADGAANVGVGMLSKTIARKKANLKQLMQDAIQQHPQLKQRFANAQLQGQLQGWGLPLGSTKRKLSGNRFLLTGDAASLIDPFTGEGIGNALVSGLVAARVIQKAVAQQNFSASFLQQYDTEIYKKLWSELKLSHYLQILSSKPALFNFVIKKASRSKELRETISCMFENVDIRKKFTNPLFYLKILLNR